MLSVLIHHTAHSGSSLSCCLNLLQAKISPGAQLLVLARYVFTFASSLVMYLQDRNSMAGPASCTSHTNSSSGSAWLLTHRSKVKLLLLFMGMLNLASYGIFNLGFAACGSALASVVLAASGQITTALISLAVLHRRLSGRHMASVAVVTAGLVLRSLDEVQLPLKGTSPDTANSRDDSISGGINSSSNSSKGASTDETHVLYGVGCVVVSALLFSILGCMYEVLMNADEDNNVSQAQVCQHPAQDPHARLQRVPCCSNDLHLCRWGLLVSYHLPASASNTTLCCMCKL